MQLHVAQPSPQGATTTRSLAPMRDLRAAPEGPPPRAPRRGDAAVDARRAGRTAYGMEVPEIRGFGIFSAFAGMYLAACDVLQTARRPRAASSTRWSRTRLDGAVWVEPSSTCPTTAPGSAPTRRRSISCSTRLDAAGGPLGIGAGLMIAADRTADRRRRRRAGRAGRVARRPGRGRVRPGQRRGRLPARAVRRRLRHHP